MIKLSPTHAHLVNRIHALYEEEADLEELPISVDILREIVRKEHDLNTLATNVVDVPAENVLGQIKFYYPVPEDVRTIEAPTSAVITIKEELNACWKRLVICKELSHVLLDGPDTRVTTRDQVIKLMEGLASAGTAVDDAPCVCENVAELLALELLFPFKLRRTHAELLSSNKISAHSLALRYRIPDEYAELGMYASTLEHMQKLFDEIEGMKPKLAIVSG